MHIKEDFERRYKELLKEDYDEFMEYSTKYINKAIRINTLKKDMDTIKSRLSEKWTLKEVPWCKEGFWIKYRDGERFDVGNLAEHQLGYIYVQDPASMLPAIVLNPQPGDLVLDTCAAPGSKTSQLAQYMNNEGLLVANDADGKRLSALGINLQRCGVSNAVITRMKAQQIKQKNFDKILVDAPCSGTGTIRRNYKIMNMYSYGLVKRLAKEQYSLLKNAFELVKEGGVVVYSTCTLEPEENEGIVSKLLEEYSDADLEDIELDIKRQKPILGFQEKTYDSRVERCLRIHPQDNDTEGFFVAKIRKK